jgi:hypothetical protein
MTDQFCGSVPANAERVRSLEETLENSSGRPTSGKKKKAEHSASNGREFPAISISRFPTKTSYW